MCRCCPPEFPVLLLSEKRLSLTSGIRTIEFLGFHQMGQICVVGDKKDDCAQIFLVILYHFQQDILQLCQVGNPSLMMLQILVDSDGFYYTLLLRRFPPRTPQLQQLATAQQRGVFVVVRTRPKRSKFNRCVMHLSMFNVKPTKKH